MRVRVHIRSGCSLCGRTDAHEHGQAEWSAHVDQVGAAARERRGRR